MFFRPGSPKLDADAVIEALENPHDRQILAACQGRELTAQEIIEGTDVPQSTAYRRIHQLQEAGLLVVESGAIKAGHPVDRYQTTVEMAALLVEMGAVEARWRLAETPEDRLHRLWSQLRGEP